MSEQILVALIVAVPTVLASAVVPTIILMMNNSSARKAKEFDAAVRKQEKIDDYTRADALEARRKKETEEVASLLKTNTAVQVASAGELRGQIQQVHALVNSNLTLEMEARLDVMHASLVSLIEIADLRKSMGHAENEGTTSRINVMREAIAELEDTLKMRHEVTDAAAIEKRTAETATKAAVAALTSTGPLPVTIQQEDTNPVPVKPIEPGPPQA